MARRAKSEGTLYQRDNGTWRAQVTVNGKRLSHTAKTKKAAQAWIKTTIGQIDRGYDGTKITVADYLDRYLSGVESSLRPRTFTDYSMTVRKHITPRIGPALVTDLTPDQLQALYDDLLDDGVGVYTVLKAHSILHAALQRAAKTGLTFRNVADLVTPPAKPDEEMKFWSEAEAARFLAAAHPNRLYALFYVAVVTGARQMEICGLKWSDLDWGKGTLRIVRQLARVGEEMFAPQKTDASRRTIYLGAKTMDVLQVHLERQAQERTLAGEKWREYDLIFTSGIGTPVQAENLVDRYFKPLITKSGVPEIRFHDLRHTAASIMLSHGRPVIVVSRILGHSKVSTTLNTYGHLIPGADQGERNMMDELLAEANLTVDDLQL